MTPAEAAELLGYCAAYDRRTLSKLDAQAWAAALPDITLDDARQAVVQHYATETAWLMPAHVRQLVKTMRRNRLDRDALPPPPPELTDDQRAYKAWMDEQIERIADGHQVTVALAAPRVDHEAHAERARQMIAARRAGATS